MGNNYKDSCEGKRRHLSFDEAKPCLQGLKLKYPDYKYYPYYCPYCMGWHIEKLKRTSSERKRESIKI